MKTKLNSLQFHWQSPKVNKDRGFCAKLPDPLSREGWGLGTRLWEGNATVASLEATVVW